MSKSVHRVATPGTILDYVAKEYPDFLSVIKSANLLPLYDTIEARKKYTLFLPAASVSFPPFDGDTAYKICKGSTVNGVLPVGVLSSSNFYLLKTLAPQNTIDVQTYQNGEIKIGGKTILFGDIFCKNGVIHIIDGVLWPNNNY